MTFAKTVLQLESMVESEGLSRVVNALATACVERANSCVAGTLAAQNWLVAAELLDDVANRAPELP